MPKNYIFFCFLCFSPLVLFSQKYGIDRRGDSRIEGAYFVDQYGDSCIYPRLNSYGDLLYYPPYVRTDSVILRGPVLMQMYGRVSFDGWSTVTSCGFDYSSSSNFSTYTRLPVGFGLGPIQTVVGGLAPARDYYVRAYATNALGTNFGDTMTVHTDIGDMVLGNLSATNVQSTSVQVRIPIVDNGGAMVSGQVCAYEDSLHQIVRQCVTIPSTSASVISVTISDLPAGMDYYLEAILTNSKTVDTLHLNVHCPSDLRLSIAAANPLVTFPCNPPEGKTYHFVAHITGTDPRKSQYQYLWFSSAGTIAQEDSLSHITVVADARMSVSACIFLGNDTIWSNSLLYDVSCSRVQASYMVCVEEFGYSASSRTWGVCGVAWVDENGDTVSTSASVRVPTGEYTFQAVDNYGCIQDTVLFIGPKVRHCTLDSPPRSSEYAHLEGETWILDSIHDREGNGYLIKQFGNQCWMRQNLRSAYAPDGFYLLHSADNPRKAYYFNNDTGPERAFQYGIRYTWNAAVDSVHNPHEQVNFAANRQGLCPDGWHIPTYAECIVLTEYVIHERFPEVEILPPPVESNQVIGRNTPVSIMLGKSCYVDFTNRNFEESLIDCSEFSLTINGTSGGNPVEYAFWMTDNIPGQVAYTFSTYAILDKGVLKGGTGRSSTRAVRCLRNP